jgi:hypothetical protein
MKSRAAPMFYCMCLLLCSACGGSNYSLFPHYQYVFTLTNPPSSTMSFTDDAVFLSFSFSASAIHFLVQNNSTKDVEVLWDEANIVQRDLAMKVVPEDSPYAERFGAHAGGKLRPHGKKTFAAVPRDNFGALSTSSRNMSFASAPLFVLNETNVDLMKLRLAKSGGPSLVFHLPIAVGDSTRDYLFEFTATGIIEASRPVGE